MRPSKISVPYLNGNPLVVIIGAEAYDAIERLRLVAAVSGLRAIAVGGNAYIEPARLARIMRELAQSTGSPVLHVPFAPAAADMKTMVGAADLLVIAPSGVGNRVWLVPRDGGAFSVHLPPWGARVCRLLIELGKHGIEIDRHLAEPIAWHPAFRVPPAPVDVTVH